MTLGTLEAFGIHIETHGLGMHFLLHLEAVGQGGTKTPHFAAFHFRVLAQPAFPLSTFLREDVPTIRAVTSKFTRACLLEAFGCGFPGFLLRHSFVPSVLCVTNLCGALILRK